MTGSGKGLLTGFGKDTKMANVTTYDAGIAGTGNGFVARLRAALADFRRYRATVDELEALNDRELADLGISRLSIRDVARGSVYGL
jgi:uncharacterized protein YjiS (DUF1127 family)